MSSVRELSDEELDKEIVFADSPGSGIPNAAAWKESLREEKERRLVAKQVEKQVAEDTCKEHGVFCCPICFNMNPA